MPVKHLDHLNLTVRDFDESVDWYRRVFGFEKVEESVQDGIRWGVVRSGEALLCLYEHPELEHVDRFELRKRGLHGVNHFALRIGDEKEWLATVARENVEVNYGGEVHWPHSRSWYVNDPTGWEIEVVRWQGDTVRFEPMEASAS
jgi:catechol 2,3-dioxygenase-like lactoylglutathione lyase family enzyme